MAILGDDLGQSGRETEKENADFLLDTQIVLEFRRVSEDGIALRASTQILWLIEIYLSDSMSTL
jgi:hypothetical protein